MASVSCGGESPSTPSPTRRKKKNTPLEKLPSVIEEKEKRRVQTDNSWARKSGLGKVFYSYDSDPNAAPVALGLYLLRSAIEAGPAPKKKKKESDKKPENSETTGGEDAAVVGGENSTQSEQGKQREKKEHEQKKEKRGATNKKGDMRARIDGEVPRASTALDGYSTTYVTSGGVHYNEDGEPVLRFFAYDKEERDKKRERAKTKGQIYSERLPQHQQRYHRSGNEDGGGSDNEGHGERDGTAPLKAVLAARRPYGQYDALSILEDAATEQKLLPPMHVGFTPCPSKFNATSVRDRRQQQKVQSSAQRLAQVAALNASANKQKSVRQSPSRSPHSSRGADSPPRSPRSPRSTTSPRSEATNNSPAKKRGGKVEPTLGGVVRVKTQRREVSSQHDAVSNMLKAKRTPGSVHLGKVMEKVEDRFQQTLVPLKERDSRRMLLELQSYQDTEQISRRQGDLDHLRAFGVRPKQADRGGLGERSTFDLQVTSGCGGGVKPTIHRQRRKYYGKAKEASIQQYL